MVYGIYDVNGYDSLSLRQYRAWIASEDAGGASPALNGNMVLLNALTPALLDSLAVRYVISGAGQEFPAAPGRRVLSSDGCDVWERAHRRRNARQRPKFRARLERRRLSARIVSVWHLCLFAGIGLYCGSMADKDTPRHTKKQSSLKKSDEDSVAD